MQGKQYINGHPIKVYDNGGKTQDRYTVIFLDQIERLQHNGTVYACLGMDKTPFYPQGFCQHSSAVTGKHLGKRINFVDLPADCQTAVKKEWS